jgi:hypothetical protein
VSGIREELTLPDVVGVPDKGDRSQAHGDENYADRQSDVEEDTFEAVQLRLGGGHTEASCIFTVKDGPEVGSEWDHGV